jgi:hypothetical protein
MKTIKIENCFICDRDNNKICDVVEKIKYEVVDEEGTLTTYDHPTYTLMFKYPKNFNYGLIGEPILSSRFYDIEVVEFLSENHFRLINSPDFMKNEMLQLMEEMWLK